MTAIRCMLLAWRTTLHWYLLGLLHESTSLLRKSMMVVAVVMGLACGGFAEEAERKYPFPTVPRSILERLGEMELGEPAAVDPAEWIILQDAWAWRDSLDAKKQTPEYDQLVVKLILASSGVVTEEAQSPYLRKLEELITGARVAVDKGTTGIMVRGPSNIVGGVGTLEANVVSGNIASGISIMGVSATLKLLQGNRVGTDRTGRIRVPNRAHGVSLSAPANTVSSNVIVSDLHGVHLGAGASGNQIRQNFIGTDVSQTKNLRNQVGVYAVNSSSSNTIVENVGANNGVGIVAEPNSIQNRISRNLFRRNVGIAIDLNGNGPSANDKGDVDLGANRSQNFPVVVSATLTNTTTLYQRYRLDSATSATSYPLTVEFFIDDGAGEGRIYLGRGTLTSPNLSTAGKSLTLSVTSSQWPANPRIVATASDSLGNSSEFSNPFSLASPLRSLAAMSAPDVSTSSHYDLNNDGKVTALDALLVVNLLSRSVRIGVVDIASLSSSYDVNGDGRVTALDALSIINRLSQENLARSRAFDDSDRTTQGTLAQWDLALMAVTQ